VLERVTRLAEGEIQRVGLSATVGNPDQLLEWLAGHCAGPRTVTKPTDPGRAAADIVIDYVGSLDNAAVVISRLHRGEKRLVFCDSRSQVEELAGRLRTNGIQTYVSHSSLSFEERRSAEQAFAEGSDCVIVSTSTLELGIDVGDLDRVIQVDAPNTVASFLQRLGRTGRRPGTQRNCLFLATTPEALLRAGALYDLWQSGYVEPIEPPAQPLHILGQQLMALCLQLQGLGLRDWPAWIGRLPPFAELGEVTFQEILNHLIQQNILHSDGPWLSLGDRAQEEYGRRNFLELVSVFTTAPLMKLLHGRKELGTVDDLAVLKSSDRAETILSLGGRSWRVLQIDWRTREVFVEPVEMAGRTRWMGMRRGLSFPVAQAVRRLLIADTEPASWSSRTREQMNIARSDYAFLRPGATVVVDDRQNSQYAWYTFAGAVINLAILQALTACGFEPVTSDDFSLRLSNPGSHVDLPASIHSLNADAVIQGFTPPSQYIRALKFNDCLPENVVAEILRSRMLCRESIEALLQEPVVIVTAGNGASPSVRMAL
jgi:ATP-dependent helicase Lhr and Lhr-like helicase